MPSPNPGLFDNSNDLIAAWPDLLSVLAVSLYSLDHGLIHEAVRSAATHLA